MNQVYVFGHKSPDTDSVCSAIVYAKIKGYTPATLGKIKKETKFALDTFNTKEPEILDSVKDKKVVLVDHNRFEQSADDIDKAEIIEIIDHHDFNFSYGKPIYIDCQPLGSTATILAKKYMHLLDKDMAGLLLCAILSDTVIFKSPTTTEEDKDIAEKLGKIAKVDGIDAFGIELKSTQSSLEGKNPKDVVVCDFKEFNMSGNKVGIGQVEVLNMAQAENLEKDFIEVIKNLKTEKNYEMVVFMVTDIIKEGSNLLFAGDKTILKKGYKVDIKEDNKVYIPNLMSRKKQVVPILDDIFSNK